MAGGTHAFDMIKRLRENENLRKHKYFKAKDTYHRPGKPHEEEFLTATTEEKEKLRARIIREQRRESIKTIKFLIISIVLTAILVVLMIKFALP
jgi:hypothetical protein